jgi:hypothetical protein
MRPWLSVYLACHLIIIAVLGGLHTVTKNIN